VLGSVTPPGRLRGALAEAAERARDGGADAQLLDLAEWKIGFADGRAPADLGADAAAVLDAVGSAGALVFATPVYRGSLTGALKNLFDLLPVESLAGKAVGTVSMGASDHHFLGADRHLRDVLAFFGALTMPVGVYLTSADFEDGEVADAAAARLDELLDGTLAAAAALAAGWNPGPAPLAARAVPRRV
jgi:FMN reductase